MTCDATRPCKRCIQRGLQTSCEDAPRKRKKYLADVPNNALHNPRLIQSSSSMMSLTGMNSQDLSTYASPFAIPMNQRLTEASTINTGSIPFQATIFQQSASLPVNYLNNEYYSVGEPSVSNSNTQSTLPEVDGDAANNMSKVKMEEDSDPFQNIDEAQNTNMAFAPRDNSTISNNSIGSQKEIPSNNKVNGLGIPDTYSRNRRTNFLSSAADLEYSTLSNILQDNFMHHQSTSTEGTPNSGSNISPVVSPNVNNSHSIATMTKLPPLNPQAGLSGGAHLNDGRNNQRSLNNYPTTSNASPSDLSMLRKSLYENEHHPKCDDNINQYFLGATTVENQIQTFPDAISAIDKLKETDAAVFQERNSKLALSFVIGVPPDENQEINTIYKEPEEIYARVVKPFSYTPGYHSLIAYLRKRFPREMLVKMAESMAIYRPSFIACTNSLKEHDLIFMEQCFQRTLLTYDNFIRVSGTPTIVWRRTGEIAYVGNEFCVLTGWKADDLLRNKFIVELLDDKSVVEYFELFSHIAFGDFLGATMTECTLLTPNPDIKIRTGCMWTLKRDVFGIPMMIIGNFLPIV
ncbi:Transcriptional regulator of nonfermentable carbon utilization [Scheffersomyces spartinae]|uniref:Transcriptional regulator of nonfermentable carbon utilization n=1 Tax=Scheffersomyces spartinae TaxID=45513 RepID=A0A9P7VCI5_9ASCO|nr:Transcriptional regulator of nonfermentable carbon utilization [Scheffersomyces spartinae]KAG7195352.1 Transcriptional regulator of nonfermentable carbon utilization [Scheffersomyces spartinae]